MEPKQCSKCKAIKPTSEFHKNKTMADGYANQCKACFKETHKKYRDSENGKKRQATYDTSDAGRASHTKANKRYKKTDKSKASYASYYLSHKDRNRARGRVFDAVRSGRMQPATTFMCKCGNPAKEYHHHLGYDNEHSFDVIPLCKVYHIIAEGS